MSKHTPTPWEVNGQMIVKDCYNEVIADVEASWQFNFPPKRRVNRDICNANAEHIVKCVNSHDELLEALKQALSYIKGDYIDADGIEERLSNVIKKAEGAK
jgi:hypothetical protein